MKAWGESQKVGTKILMLGDPFLKFTRSIGAEVDKSEKGLGIRSNRYTMLIDNGFKKNRDRERDSHLQIICCRKIFRYYLVLKLLTYLLSY